MRSLNKVMLIGNLGADPEIRHTPSGQSVATLRMATNEVWKDREGTKQERTEWHRVVAWGRLAEIAREYLSKGRQIYVEGRLQTRQWQDQQGQTRYTTEIIGAVDPAARRAGGGPDDGTVGGGRRARRRAAARAVRRTRTTSPIYEEPGPVGGEEDTDLPF